MKMSQLTSIGWCANMLLDQRKQASFTFDDLYQAVDNHKLVELLRKNIDDSGIIDLWARDDAIRQDIEDALADAAGALRAREIRKSGVGENVLCLIIAIVLEAIQQQHRAKKIL